MSAFLRRFLGLAALVLVVVHTNGVQAQRSVDLRAVLRNVSRPTFPRTSQQTKAAFERRAPKVDPLLLQLADDVNAKGFGDFSATASDLGIPVDARRVLVTLHADNENDVDDVARAVERLGGDVGETLDNMVFARVPVDALERLSAIDPLYFATPQSQYRATQVDRRGGQVVSEGVAASKIEHLHRGGITGKGVKIGILDFGFKGLSQLVAAGEIQRPKATRAFGGPSVENVEEGHGSACAEIVHDMAPDADLYLAMAGAGDGTAGDEDLIAGARWLAEQGVDIISFSGGGQDGPHNGRAPLDMLVAEISTKNILWVNAAANDGAKHWSGMVQDRDGDGIMEIDDRGTWPILMHTSSAIPVIVLQINWDDWGTTPGLPSASQDIDAYLFEVLPSGDLQMVAKSENRQNGRGKPSEAIGYRVTGNADDKVFALALRATNVTRPVKLHVYSRFPLEMLPETAVGSIGIPATSSQALAVGAVNVRNATLEDYSSQGPTDDGRLKPDVSAADNTVTVSYRSENPEGRFQGTSAACPHVSGFAALVKQLNQGANAERLRQLVMTNVRDMGRPGPDNEFGTGHIDGSKLTPPGTTTGISIGGNEIVENVPDAFGDKELSQGDFEKLWQIARRERQRDDLKVVTGREAYRVGDGLKVGIRSDQACYYMLVHRDARGRFTVLAPEGRDARLEAGRRYALPENETWNVSEPLGREGLMVVCSAGPLELAGWIDNPAPGRVWFATTTYDVNR